MIDVLARRRAGVLLHPTSLPGPRAVGTLGAEAYRFVDFLREGAFSVWQTLPLGPADRHGSPYCLRSAYAGDTRLIDVAELRQRDDLPLEFAFDAVPDSPTEAYRSFELTASSAQKARLADFARRQREWLLPYGLFCLCERRFEGEPWWMWPRAYRDPVVRTLLRSWAEARAEFRGIVLMQYLFERQWSSLKRYANGRGVYTIDAHPDEFSISVVNEYLRLKARGEL